MFYIPSIALGMASAGIRIWLGILIIMPFTCILTFVVTMIICSQTPNDFQSKGPPPKISDIGTGQAHNYFMGGFIILVPQILIMFIGRIHFLIVSQSIVGTAIIMLTHVLLLFCGAFILIMAIHSENAQRTLHLIGAVGTFFTLALYCIFHTIIIVYLFIRRSKAPEHSNIFFPVWFSVCTIISIVSTTVLAIMNNSVAEYFAAGIPFVYFLAFVPSFWSKFIQSRQKIEPTLSVDNNITSTT